MFGTDGTNDRKIYKPCSSNINMDRPHKYRGKYKGQRRGLYVRAAFVLESPLKKSGYDDKIGGEIKGYLEQKGDLLDDLSVSTPDHSPLDALALYHFAGATVIVAEQVEPELHQQRVFVRFASNSGLADVVQKLASEVPSFRKFKKVDGWWKYYDVDKNEAGSPFIDDPVHYSHLHR